MNEVDIMHFTAVKSMLLHWSRFNANKAVNAIDISMSSINSASCVDLFSTLHVVSTYIEEV